MKIVDLEWITSEYFRRIIWELVNEENYSDEELEPLYPKKNYKKYHIK